MPIATIIIGLCRSGKSHLAKELAAKGAALTVANAVKQVFE
jgi:adenosyl cobinamide kinase/adenosyl cobinamide phosphate guanylyltransferase